SIVRFQKAKECCNNLWISEKITLMAVADFNLIADALPDAVISINNKGKITYWNPSSERLFGYAAEEAIGQDLYKLIIPERFHEDYRKGIKEFRSTGKGSFIGKNLELIALRKGGIEFPVEFSLTSIRINGIWHDVGIVRDITERKEAERRMEDTNKLLKMFTENNTRKEFLDMAVRLIRNRCGCSHAGIRVIDRNGNIPFESYDGYSEDFISCESPLSVHYDQCVCIRATTGEYDPQDTDVLTPNGSFLYHNFVDYINRLDAGQRKRYRDACALWGFKSIATIPVRYNEKIIGLIHLADERGGIFSQELLGFMETLSYIIGEAIAKFNAQEELVRLATATESAADAIVITNGRGIIQYVNPAFEQITGYSRDEIIGENIHILDSKEQGEDFYGKVREILKNEGVWKGRLINKKKDGTIYHEECTISAVRDSDGEIINYISIKRDNTEMIRLESIAEAVNTMKNMGYIFSGIRHEIGNPVNSIKMTLSMLRENLDRFDLAVVQKYLERSIDEIRRIEYLLKVLKNYNMYEKAEPQDINLEEFMDRFLALIKDDFLKKGIYVSVEISPDAESCYADPRALHQVLMNVITNASDACEGRKDPTVSISISRNLEDIKIQVRDNGRGMTDEEVKNLFRPFFTTKPGGTGLGLVIAKRMLALMNGTIDVESRKNKGTIVNILIPRGANAG
ncbi:MAG: PAS domain S-box protein, partial [Thermodesulfovibrionales bacterium]